MNNGMKVIRNKYIPFGGYKLINIFGFVFCKEKANITAIDLNHEQIHTEQMRELLYIGYYPLYAILWVYSVFKVGFDDAYRYNPMEREAYRYQDNLGYCLGRKWFAWVKC